MMSCLSNITSFMIFNNSGLLLLFKPEINIFIDNKYSNAFNLLKNMIQYLKVLNI